MNNMALLANEQFATVCSDENCAILPWLQSINQQLLAAYQSQRLPHAINFVGPQYLGKLQFARQFARRLLCTSPAEEFACGQCKSCLLCAAGTHPDWLNIEPEAVGKVLKIDTIRFLQSRFQQTAQQGDKKIAIVGPAEQMNENAANALLKILEEPPADTYFILLTHHSSKLLPTIRSRCQRISFSIPAEQAILNWLGDGYPKASVQSAMRLGRGLPMRVKEILDTDLDIDSEWDMLASLFSGAASAQDLSAKIDKEQLPGFLENLLRLISDCAKKNQAVEEASALGRSSDPLFAQLTTKALQGMYREVATAKLALAQNAHPKLLLESVLLSCLGIYRKFNS